MIRYLPLLFLAGCTMSGYTFEGIQTIPPECIEPAAYLSCDIDEGTGVRRCWVADGTDWLFGNDGSRIHERRVADSDGVHVTILCLAKAPAPEE